MWNRCWFRLWYGSGVVLISIVAYPVLLVINVLKAATTETNQDMKDVWLEGKVVEQFKRGTR